MAPSSQSWLKQWDDSKADKGNGEHKELDGESDEHFGDVDLFAGQTGGSLAAPADNLSESDGRDGGGYHYDNRAADRENPPINQSVQSADHGFVPEIVIVHVGFPRNPLSANLAEARDLIHGSNGESPKPND